MRSLIDMTIGMSCSMMRIDEPRSRWIVLMSGPNASVSFCATPAVGSSSRISRASSASSDAELDDAARAGGELAEQVVGVAAEAEVAR